MATALEKNIIKIQEPSNHNTLEIINRESLLLSIGKIYQETIKSQNPRNYKYE